MYYFNRFINSLINKLSWVALTLLIALLSFFLGLSKCQALESEQWTDGGLSTNITDNVVLSSDPEYSFSDYSSNYIRNFVYTQVNQTYYDSTLSEVDFYKQYNYVVYPISSSTLRIYIQDYNVLMDYQGLNPIEGNDTKFFFWNIYCSTYIANITTHYLNIGVFYNMYIDLNYNTESFTWSSDASLFDVYREYITSYSSSSFPYSMNLDLYDSYNNNFAWVESFASEWLAQFNYNYKWRDIAQFSFGNISALYYYGLMDFPTLGNVATPPEESDPGGGGSGEDNPTFDTTIIEDILKRIEDILEDNELTKSEQSGKDFFDNIDYSDYGAFSDFVLIPIRFLQSVLGVNNYCSNVSFNVNLLGKSNDASLPNGCNFWNTVPSSVVSLYHLIIYGIISYRFGIFLFRYYEKFKSPGNSEVKTLDL